MVSLVVKQGSLLAFLSSLLLGVDHFEERALLAAGAWAHLREVLRARPAPQLPLVLLCDANGRVGSVESLGVGAYQAAPETLNGSELRETVDAFDLRLPATYEDTHFGEEWTWVSAQHTLRRIDYCCLPQAWFGWTRTVSSWVEYTIDLGTHRFRIQEAWIPEE